ncbi:MAG: hypothetical protein V4726_06755 [Verrucomicrobiota bacterium]
MHDLKFSRLFDIDLPDPDESKFKSATAQQAVRIFHDNASRAVGGALATGFAAVMSSRLTTSAGFFTSVTEAEGRLKSVASHFERGLGKVSPETMMEELKAHSAFHEQVLSGYPTAHRAYEGVLKSVLVETWTTLEVLCEGLYRGAVRETYKEPWKSTPLEKERKAGISFRSRGKSITDLGIRRTFHVVFANACIDNLLANTLIDALANIRNLISHKAGVADKEFNDWVPKCAPHLNAFANLKQDVDSLHPDGDTVKSLVEPAFKEMYKLIQLVDAWITNELSPPP